MSEGSRVEASPRSQGERLTLRGAKGALVVQLCFILLISGCGLYLLSHGGRMPAALCCVWVVVNAGYVPTFWKRYRMVRSGATVTVHPKPSSQVFRVHPGVAVVVTSLITLVVLAMGGVTLYILPSLSRMMGVQALLIGFNLFIWLLTGFLWYRIVTERRKITVVEPLYEQVEGVWPPAPQVPKIE